MGLSEKADEVLKGFMDSPRGKLISDIAVAMTLGIALGWYTQYSTLSWVVCAFPLGWVLIMVARKVEPMVGGGKKEAKPAKVLIPAGQAPSAPVAPKLLFPLAGTPDVTNFPVKPEAG